MRISLYNITGSESLIIKAFAIILIAFHNFLHWTNDIGENEMFLDPDKIFYLFYYITDYPLSAPGALFSYLGHYGVQLFIFSSGYGLCKQALNNKFQLTPGSYKQYIKKRLIKIYALMIFGILTCFIFYIDNIGTYLENAMYLILGVKNFSYDLIFKGVGPWWYFILAIQLYFLFPLLYYLVDKYKGKGICILLLASYLLIYLCFPLTEYLRIPLYGNFIGHLPEFILGIGLAYFANRTINLKIIIISLLVFALSNFYEIFFPFSFMSITILLLSVIYSMRKYYTGYLKTVLIFIGKISMFIFIINGALRTFTINYILAKYSINVLLLSFIHFVMVLVLSYLMYLIYNRIRLFMKSKLMINI